MPQTQQHSFGFFDVTSYNEDGTPNLTYNAEEFARAMNSFAGTCIMEEGDFTCDFSSKINMVVSVGTGMCWVGGYWVRPAQALTVDLNYYKVASLAKELWLGIRLFPDEQAFEVTCMENKEDPYFLPIEHITSYRDCDYACQVEHKRQELEVFAKYDAFPEITAGDILDILNEVFNS